MSVLHVVCDTELVANDVPDVRLPVAAEDRRIQFDDCRVAFSGHVGGVARRIHALHDPVRRAPNTAEDRHLADFPLCRRGDVAVQEDHAVRWVFIADVIVCCDHIVFRHIGSGLAHVLRLELCCLEETPDFAANAEGEHSRIHESVWYDCRILVREDNRAHRRERERGILAAISVGELPLKAFYGIQEGEEDRGCQHACH